MKTTSQESHVPCTPSATSCPADTSQGSQADPSLRISGGHPRGMHRNPQIRMQFVPSHHFLQLWLVSTCPSDTAELTALHPLEDSHQGKPWSSFPLQTPSEKQCPTLQTQKHSTKTFSWLSSPASPTSDPHETSPLNSYMGTGRCWHFPASELNRSNT